MRLSVRSFFIFFMLVSNAVSAENWPVISNMGNVEKAITIDQILPGLENKQYVYQELEYSSLFQSWQLEKTTSYEFKPVNALDETVTEMEYRGYYMSGEEKIKLRFKVKRVSRTAEDEKAAERSARGLKRLTDSWGRQVDDSK